MPRIRARKIWLISAIVIASVFSASLLALEILSPRLTSYVQSDEFRAEMEKETAKGLHFPSGHYEPIRRTSNWIAESAGFQARNGSKAMSSIEAQGITAKFNPWGVFLRRWQLDQVRVQGGEVGIQVYEPKPEPSPAKPWYAIFLPDRVYLKRVESEPVDVTWRFREKRAGFFGTRLLITPHGRDFEYQGRGGELKMTPLPELRLQHTHLLITKTLLTLYNLDLQSKSEATATIHAEGKAGTREDKSVDFKINFERVPIQEWLPNEWGDHVTGNATTTIHWQGDNPKFEKSRGNVTLRVEGAHLSKLPFLQKLAALTNERELEHLKFNECKLDLDWHYPEAAVKHLLLEDKGKLRAEGEVTLREKNLGGAIELGVARRLLDWLPKADEVFPREHAGYLWTTVHLSGTLDAPEQDLSPRIVEAIEESPGAALGILFRGIGEWLKDVFGSR
jgi:hypothetical protein